MESEPLSSVEHALLAVQRAQRPQQLAVLSASPPEVLMQWMGADTTQQWSLEVPHRHSSHTASRRPTQQPPSCSTAASARGATRRGRTGMRRVQLGGRVVGIGTASDRCWATHMLPPFWASAVSDAAQPASAVALAAVLQPVQVQQEPQYLATQCTLHGPGS